MASPDVNGGLSLDALLRRSSSGNTKNKLSAGSSSNNSVYTAATVSTEWTSGTRYSVATSRSACSDDQSASVSPNSKFLRFSEDVSVKYTFSSKDLSEKEKRKLWYRPKEYKRIKQQAFQTLKEYRQQMQPQHLRDEEGQGEQDQDRSEAAEKVSLSNEEPICVDGLLKNENTHALLHERHFHQTLANKIIAGLTPDSTEEERAELAESFRAFCLKSRQSIFLTTLSKYRKVIRVDDKYLN